MPAEMQAAEAGMAAGGPSTPVISVAGFFHPFGCRNHYSRCFSTFRISNRLKMVAVQMCCLGMDEDHLSFVSCHEQRDFDIRALKLDFCLPF